MNRQCRALIQALAVAPLLLAVSAALPPGRVSAQENVDHAHVPAPPQPPSPAHNMLDALATQPAPGAPGGNASPTLPTVWCADIDDPETKATCWRAYQASLNYYARGLDHRSKVFQWQHTSTIAIFFTVLALVGAGLYFAWLQFIRDLKRPGGAGSASASSVEMSPTGLKVSSPVLGVIILALSLAFFYLYLIYAYPISELF